MLDLYLMRHAKSSWSSLEFSDRDRVLNTRGERDAPRMGAFLSNHFQAVSPYVSPARRAELTWAGVSSMWPALASLDYYLEEAIYTFCYLDLLGWLKKQKTDAPMFLIGHNPALTELINYLALSDVIDNLPTAGFAHLVLSIAEWSNIEAGTGRLSTLVVPRDIV